MLCSGGGMVISNSSLLTLYNIDFINNYAWLYAGGLYLQNSNTHLSDINFLNNFGNHVGGLYIEGGHATMNTMTFANNQGHVAALDIYNASPELNNIVANSNMGYFYEDYNMYSGYTVRTGWNSAPILRNIIIANNQCSGIDMHTFFPLSGDVPFLSHATIYGNMGIGLRIKQHMDYWNQNNGSTPILKNIIEYGNSGLIGAIDENGVYQESDNCGISCWQTASNQGYGPGEYLDCDITYSSITTCLSGESDYFLNLEGNIVNENPHFTNGSGSDYTLQPNSPCIDTGAPDSWSQDIDETRSDMGFYGGLFLSPNFTDYDFNEIGGIQSSVDFKLYNYRDTPITINSVLFETNSFSTNTSFPITINPLETGTIEISCLPETTGSIEDSMVLNSNELPEGLAVNLSVNGVPEENILSGNLSGFLDVGVYEVTSDINITIGDTLYIAPGTELLFHNNTGLTVNGVLKAQGTQQDSIIFDSYCYPAFCGNELFSLLWNGIHFNNVTSETELNYVKIETDFPNMYDEFIGISLANASPIISNIQFTSKGIISMSNSSPDISNIIFSQSGVIYVHDNSTPVFNNIIMNTTDDSYSGSGFKSENSNSVINSMFIEGFSNGCSSDNSWNSIFEFINSNFTLDTIVVRNNCLGGGISIIGASSDGTISNTIIEENNGHGIYIANSSPALNNISIMDNGLSGILIEDFLQSPIDVSPLITNTIISGNGSLVSESEYIHNGGGIHLKGSSPTFINTTVTDNIYQ